VRDLVVGFVLGVVFAAGSLIGWAYRSAKRKGRL
jgi:predicted negative regulator of RcsB-dependent stress response